MEETCHYRRYSLNDDWLRLVKDYKNKKRKSIYLTLESHAADEEQFEIFEIFAIFLFIHSFFWFLFVNFVFVALSFLFGDDVCDFVVFN